MKRELIIFILIIWILVCFNKANAVFIKGITRLGWCPYANTHNLVIANNYLYCSSGNCLLILDITNPSSPVKKGELSGAGNCKGGGPTAGRFYALNGNYLYVTQFKEGLVIVDVSDPSNPNLVMRYDPDDLSIDAVSTQGSYVYLATNEGLKILNVSDPANPYLVGNLSGSSGGVIVSGNYAYYNSGSKVSLIDISTPDAPNEVGSYNSSKTVYDLAIDTVNNYLFSACYGRVDIVDISNPVAPSGLGTYTWGSNNYSTIAISGGYLYVAAHDNRVFCVDVSNPVNPAEVAIYAYYAGYPRNPVISGNNLYLSLHYMGVEVINISNPSSPNQVAVYHSLCNIPPESNKIPIYGRPFKVDICGNTACVVDDKGLLTYDVTDSSQPEFKAYLDLHGRGWDIVAKNNLAYCAMTWSGFKIVDVTDPASPILLTDYNPAEYINAVAVENNYAYLSCEFPSPGFTGVKVFNVSNPSSITYAGEYSFSPIPFAMDVRGDYLYIAGRSEGLRILDVSNPASITQVGQFKDEQSATSGVAVLGDYAYITESGAVGLRIIDISDPENPFFVGSCNTPNHPDYASKEVVVVNGYAYVGDLGGGLRIIDIMDPSSPIEVGYYEREDGTSTQGVSVSAEGLIYLAQWSNGFEILTIRESPILPTIISHSPTGEYISVDTNISVTFSEVMNQTSAENAFSLFPSVSGSFSWEGNKMVFDPDSHLSYETIYTIAINTEAKDLDGNKLASEYSWQFTTIGKYPERKVIVYPNPYIKGTSLNERITFINLSKESTLRIYTIAGKLIKEIKHKSSTDDGTEEWDIQDIASGVYLYYIESPQGKKNGKVSIIK